MLGDDVPQVAVFDTAFHQTMPEHAYLYSIPYKYYENDKLRRYGFHGTSHRYVTLRAAELLGKDPEDLKIVSCHLGNGSSLAAVDGGKCVDTSMGLTPLAGLPMGTRAGDMDVGVIEYVANKYDRSISSVMEGLNKRSGMMGLSGVSSDFRDLEAAAAKGHHRSAIALRIFEYRVHKMIAEYAAAMNGVDVVVFTAGVGENAPSTRAHILEGLEFMGITCDEEKNNVRGEERIISKDGAPVTVMVIPTNEELMIAQDTPVHRGGEQEQVSLFDARSRLLCSRLLFVFRKGRKFFPVVRWRATGGTTFPAGTPQAEGSVRTWRQYERRRRYGAADGSGGHLLLRHRNRCSADPAAAAGAGGADGDEAPAGGAEMPVAEQYAAYIL